VGTEPDTVVSAARELLSSPTAYQQMANAINPFGDGKASDRIVKIVSHYFRI
jgi:UDP-N-acetylglucosamine 2-epimerase (non-hydrolysing)